MTTENPPTAEAVRAGLDALREGSRMSPGPKCAVERITVKLAKDDPAVGSAVWEACDDTSITPSALVAFLADKFDEHIAAGTVRRHRRRHITTSDTCRCPL